MKLKYKSELLLISFPCLANVILSTKHDVIEYIEFEEYLFASVRAIKMTTLWDVMPCSLKVDWSFISAYCLHHQHPDDGGSSNLWNVGLLQRDYTALHPRRLSSSYSPQWDVKSRSIGAFFLWLFGSAPEMSASNEVNSLKDAPNWIEAHYQHSDVRVINWHFR
jgi:hypothetical protein